MWSSFPTSFFGISAAFPILDLALFTHRFHGQPRIFDVAFCWRFVLFFPDILISLISWKEGYSTGFHKFLDFILQPHQLKISLVKLSDSTHHVPGIFGGPLIQAYMFFSLATAVSGHSFLAKFPSLDLGKVKMGCWPKMLESKSSNITYTQI